jgi:hypothetical protein
MMRINNDSSLSSDRIQRSNATNILVGTILMAAIGLAFLISFHGLAPPLQQHGFVIHQSRDGSEESFSRSKYQDWHGNFNVTRQYPR